MGKLIALGVLVFLAAGIALNQVIDTIFSPEAEERIQSTYNRHPDPANNQSA